MRVKELIKKITPSFLFPLYHFFLSWLGAVSFGFPSRKMIIIGVTGTSGKSTVVELVYQILREAGFKVAALSSIDFHLGSKTWLNKLKMTMPGRFYLQQFLAQARKEKCQYVVLEVTSEGILQSRHRFIDFDLLVFTNLSPEHIERHGGFENYKKTKGKLFALLGKTRMMKNHQFIQKTIIANLDDLHASYFLAFTANQKIGYSLKKQVREIDTIQAEDIVLQEGGSEFNVKGTNFSLALPGQFNISNALAAIAVGYSQGVSFSVMARALAKVKTLPGRLELVVAKPFRVYVDYAHTPVALEKVYQTLQKSSGQMVCLLGSCGGGRDKWKRPVLGEIASRYCQRIIITNEDPYDENPEEIINQVKAGVKKTFPSDKVLIVLDRRQAIQRALRLAHLGDTVIITGKGSEPLMCLAQGKKIPWSDKDIVLEEMKKIKGFSA